MKSGFHKMSGYLTNPTETVNSACLCAPEAELSCFGCCPPIRPAQYDPLDYRGSLTRELCENRSRYLREGPRLHPIIGFSCWALGFLDARGRTAGCLLHPCQNQGEDLRHCIDYGDKCRREQCEPARVFSLLSPEGQEFWLPLARGLSAFYYSSPRANPLFHLLQWGVEVLERMRDTAQSRQWSPTELLWREVFLTDPLWRPKAHRYLFRLMLEAPSAAGYENEEWHSRAKSSWLAFVKSPEIRRGVDPSCQEGMAFAHTLGLDPDFQNLLRLGLGWRRCAPHAAVRAHRLLLDLL